MGAVGQPARGLREFPVGFGLPGDLLSALESVKAIAKALVCQSPWTAPAAFPPARRHTRKGASTRHRGPV